MYNGDINTVQLTADPVSGFEVYSFADVLFAAIVMALLAIAGFVFLQWFLFDAVSWIELEPGHPHYRL